MARNITELIEITDNREEILEIAKLAQAYIWKEYSIDVKKSEGIPTIAYWFFRAAIKYLNDNKSKSTDISINLLNLMEMGISYREEEGEKDGNYTPFMSPGSEFMNVVVSDIHNKYAEGKVNEAVKKKDEEAKKKKESKKED